ncbi:hypothetical protein MKX01_017441 [Papaver californicum]|nr:hypothetical protein MKX01_017441 [Papaver californicum]
MFFLLRPFSCPVNDCHSSYRRKDHLNRYLLQHQGLLFSCPVEGCNQTFAYKGNVKRHIEDMHEDERSSSSDSQGQTQHICQKIGCGKVFKYASRLRNMKMKLESVEAICCELDCMKYFANNDCLKAHVQSCHQHVLCDVCGTKQLKKNMKRHMRGHEIEGSTERIKCSIKGYYGQRFSFKHVRDKLYGLFPCHLPEKSGSHVYVHMNNSKLDKGEKWKRSCPTVETLLRKRVVPPSHTDSTLNYGSEYLAWLLSAEND